MKKYRILLFAMVLFSAMGMMSCSEDDNTIEEYPNWQATNDAYFNNLTDSVLNLISLNPSRTDWKRIKSWSKSDTIAGRNSDYILVHVVKEADASETVSPIYTDTVAVHYMGKLLPSVSYKYGYVFDQSYDGDLDETISVPSEFAIGNSTGNNLVDGFATALQHMHKGDRWIVYIPYQLGYGSTANSSIPAFSTLIFDVTLAGFRHADQ